jgi:hypothetical protein
MAKDQRELNQSRVEKRQPPIDPNPVACALARVPTASPMDRKAASSAKQGADSLTARYRRSTLQARVKT